MVEQSVAARPGDPRVSIGNPSLDAMLEGGLVGRRPYLIVGPSGTGKTTLAIQFLCDGVRRGERVLLVTLEEPPNEARVNHRGLEPELGRVDVFDAIPDIMRYERTPFKDIASVRSAVPFDRVPFQIRRSPELASVEVTITALEQMLRTEVIRRGYTRLAIDSLTALQYFCMKGFDPTAGAQSFLRFLSDLRVTTLLTVEAPLEDVETPERMLARGEIRLFRWELDGQTVRAVGVEKFRGSSHDVRLHPYRIGPQGIDVNLERTISRDTRQIIEPIVPHVVVSVPVIAPVVSPVTPLLDDVRDLVLLGASVAPVRAEVELALAAVIAERPDDVQNHLTQATAALIGLVDTLGPNVVTGASNDTATAAALARLRARADTVRTGIPPTGLPARPALEAELGALLSLLPVPSPVVEPRIPPPPPPPEEVVVVPVAAPPTTVMASVPEPPTPPSPVGPPPAAVELVSESAAPAPLLPPLYVPEPPPPMMLEKASEPGAAVPQIPRKSLPAPPNPRPSTASARTAKPTPTPLPPRVAKPAEQPPLPTAFTPEWLRQPPHPAPAAVFPGGSGSPPASATSAPSGPAAAAPAPAPVKKRRKSTSTSAGRKGATATRGAGPRTALAHGEAGTAVSPAAAPELPRMGPAPPVEPETSPKTRRRAPRKRKAPPVVRVDVEPIPPGVFGSPADGSKIPDRSDPASPPEG